MDHTENSLPTSCLNTIEAYLNQSGKPTPYYRHLKKNGFFQKRYLIGKGSPSETNKYQTGIDCSGFISHVINSSKPIRTVIKATTPNYLKKILFFFRPIENTNVKTLVHPHNSFPVKINNTQPGDLIHIGDEHILLIYKIEGEIIHYVHASEKHKVVITGVIKNQIWKDKYYQNKFLTIPNSGIRRLFRWP